MLSLLQQAEVWIAIGSLLGVGGMLLWQVCQASPKESTASAAPFGPEPLPSFPHWVNNHLQIISSLLRLQSRTIDDPAIKAAILEVQHRIHAIALVHQSSTRQTGRMMVDMQALLRSLGNRMCERLPPYKRPLLSLDAPPVTLDLDLALPLGMMVHELLFQTIRAGQPSVILSLSTEKIGQLALTITVPPPKPIQPEHPLGERLIQLLCQQLEASYQTSWERDKHTTTVVFPASR